MDFITQKNNLLKEYENKGLQGDFVLYFIYSLFKDLDQKITAINGVVEKNVSKDDLTSIQELISTKVAEILQDKNGS